MDSHQTETLLVHVHQGKSDALKHRFVFKILTKEKSPLID